MYLLQVTTLLPSDMTTLEKIDKLRIERGWTINNLAMEALLTQSTINNLYSRKSEPKLSTLTATCNAFDITLSEFFREEEEQEEEGYLIDETLKNTLQSLTLLQKKALLSFLKTL